MSGTLLQHQLWCAERAPRQIGEVVSRFFAWAAIAFACAYLAIGIIVVVRLSSGAHKHSMRVGERALIAAAIGLIASLLLFLFTP